jgi:hypothetical protein
MTINMSELKLSNTTIDNVIDKVVNKSVNKLTKGISNIIKKTIVFEKTERIECIFIGILICTSIFGVFTIYNTYHILSLKDKIYKLDKIDKIK